MNFSKIKVLLIALVVVFSFSFNMPVKGDLVINIGNIKKEKGTIWIGLYDSEENFLVKENSILRSLKVDKKGDAQITLSDINFGTYALAIFHDVNGNGKLDKNLVGIPKEPYAFVNWPKSKWRVPLYEELIFDFLKPNQTVTAELTTWWEM